MHQINKMSHKKLKTVLGLENVNKIFLNFLKFLNLS